MASPQIQPITLGAGNYSGVLLGLILRSPPVRGADRPGTSQSPSQSAAHGRIGDLCPVSSAAPALAGFYPSPCVPGHHFPFSLLLEIHLLPSHPHKLIPRAQPSPSWERGPSLLSQRKGAVAGDAAQGPDFNWVKSFLGLLVFSPGFLPASKTLIGVELFWSGSWEAVGFI